VITYLDIQVLRAEEAQYQELYLKAMSNTCLLDQKKEYAAFQKKSASYKEVFDKVLSNYPDVKYFFGSQMPDTAINSFVVQYEESDWEFISRLASRRGVPLKACDNAKGINFTAGIIWGTAVYEILEEDAGEIETIYDEGYYLRCQIDDPDAPVFEVGDCISYKGKKYYVRKTELKLENQTLRQICLICSQNEFLVSEIQNPFLTGLSLPGSVSEVKGNQLRISLNIDKMEETECWFVYSTFYATFYCMPEKDDKINLYFPDFTEDHAFVLNSVGADPQDAVMEGVSGTGTGKNGTGGRTTQDDDPARNSQESQEVDISQYISMLVNTENAKLVNVEAAFSDDGLPDEKSQGMTASGQGTAGYSDGTSGRGGSTGANYDFSVLARNPNIKVLCSKNGRMVILDDEHGSVSIVCDNGTYISLDDNGINIITDEKIEFCAAEDIRLKARKTICLSADEEISISCQDSYLNITPEKIMMFGKNIRMNEE